MPNLVGIHDPTASAERLARDLGKMMRAVDLPAFDYLRPTVVEAPLAVGNVLTRVENALAQPARDDARGLWLMLDGEILGAAELSRRLAQEGVDVGPEDDARLALAAFVTFGPRAFDLLNGQWNVVVFDRGTRETWLASDRVGSRLLYLADDAGRLVFGSEVKGVIAGRAVPTRPGGLGFLQLLLGGYHVGHRTWLEGIRALDAGTWIRIGANGERRTHRYRRWHFREGGPETSEASYAEGFARRLVSATERAMRHHEGHPVAITLSGGLDSRSVALSINRARLPITSITYGDADSADAMYAAQLAEVIGLSHHHIEPLGPALVERSSQVMDEILGPSPSGRRGFHSAQLDRIVWRSEGMTAMSGVASTLWHALYRQYMRVMLNGACGDAMTGSHLAPALLLSPPRESVMRALLASTHFASRSVVARVLAPEFARRYMGEVDQAFFDTFREIDADEALAVSNIWDMENRQRRGTFSASLMERYFCTCRSPFLDHELVDFLCTIPGRWRFQQRIYKRMIVDHFPEAAHVPWAYTRGRITKSPTFEFAREAFNFAKWRVKARLPFKKSDGAHWNFRDDARMLQEDRDLALTLQAFTRSEVFPSDVLDRRGILDLVDVFASTDRPRELAPLFAHLVGLAKACTMFLGTTDLAVPPAADPSRFGVDVRAVS